MSLRLSSSPTRARCARTEHPSRLAYITEHVDPLTEERIELDVPSEGTHMPSMLTWYWGSTPAAMRASQGVIAVQVAAKQLRQPRERCNTACRPPVGGSIPRIRR